MRSLCAIQLALAALLMVHLPLTAQESRTNIPVQQPIEVWRSNTGAPVGFTPFQFRSIYGFNRIPNQGEGATVAVIVGGDDPNISSDLAFYANYFHLTPCRLQVVKVGEPPEGGWDEETSMDVEQICALAPQANIVLVEANSGNLPDLLAATGVATAPPYNADVVSISWGFGEFENEQQYDRYFCNVVNGNGHPVTFVAASGDGGHNHPSYPAASPCVIAAGGTTVHIATALPPSSPLTMNYGSESAWFGSTGGVSSFEPQPAWQNQACATWSSTNRCLPDVASDADILTGVPVYDTYTGGDWFRAGGTSLAAPDWSAFFGLVNSARLAAGKNTLGSAASDLYTVYYSDGYHTNLHDVVLGTNGNCGSQCTTGPGYDLVTGIGTYQAQHLFQILVEAGH
jgi:subtilase family serine protease